MDKEELKQKYDAECKKILSIPRMLANVSKACIKEYQDLSIEEILDLFEIDTKSSIQFYNSEDISINKHKIFYDIYFRSRLPNNDKIGILIDLESQSKIDKDYPIINRAYSYVSTVFASQTKKEILYSDLDKAYSIWICSDASSGSKTDIFVYETCRDSIFKSKVIKEDYKLINVVIIYLGKDIDEVIKNDVNSYTHLLKLIRLTLLRGSKLDSTETQNILKKEYNITIEREDIKNMCNFSDAFEYDCIQEGKALGLKQGEMLGLKQGEEIGLKQGEKQGTINAIVGNINNLLKKLGISYDEAINILEVDESIRKDVLKEYRKKYEKA